MTHLDSHPIPADWHADNGYHITPQIKAWVEAADPASPRYDPDRAVRGYEVEADQEQKRRFYAHIQEHINRGDDPKITEV